jgi:hypothetical protein
VIRLARLINNTNNWTRPSGTQIVDGFTTEHGFGYEEWLNSPYLTTNEVRYGFIQALHERAPKGDCKKVFLYTYDSGIYKIVGVINNLTFVRHEERDEIERSLIIGHEENFQNGIRAVGGTIPQNQNDRRFKINFSVPKKSDLIISDQNAVDITARAYPALHAYFKASRLYRLSVLYKLDLQLYNEIAKIEKHLANN